MSADNPMLVTGGDGEGRSYEELAHKLFDKKLKEWSTEIRNPDAMATLDAAMMGLIKDEFAGTGLEKDMKNFVDMKRINWIAKDRKRAGETERIASAAAQRESERREWREKLMGSLER